MEPFDKLKANGQGERVGCPFGLSWSKP